jgi:hypothetical protein
MPVLHLELVTSRTPCCEPEEQARWTDPQARWTDGEGATLSS